MKLECTVFPGQAGDVATIHDLAKLCLEPFAIIDKRVFRQPLYWLYFSSLLIFLQSQRRTWIGDRRSLARGAQQHSRWRTISPELHRLAKDPNLHSEGL